MKHTLKGFYESKTIYLDGEKLNIYHSYNFRKFSETFDWGNTGPGAAQLALAIILEITGLHTGFSRFKYETIAGIPKANFDIQFDLDNNNVRKKIMIHAHAVNTCLTYEHLKTLSNAELLANVHPLEREDLAKEIGLLIK